MMRTAGIAALFVVTLFPLRAYGQQGASRPEIPPGPEAASEEAPAAEPGTAGSSEAGAEHPETYLDFAVAGGWLMIPIGAASLLWLTFLVERAVALRRRRILPVALVKGIEELEGGAADRARLDALLSRNPSSAARILKAAADHADEPRDELEQAVGNAAQREVHSMRRYVRLFAVIAAVTPLLGLLGTVTGMIQAFREVAIQGLGSGQALAPGIYKALVTTAAGLIVAIPALLTYHWLMSRTGNYIHAIDGLVVDFVEAHRRRTRRETRGRELEGAGAAGFSEGGA